MLEFTMVMVIFSTIKIIYANSLYLFKFQKLKKISNVQN